MRTNPASGPFASGPAHTVDSLPAPWRLRLALLPVLVLCLCATACAKPEREPRIAPAATAGNDASAAKERYLENANRRGPRPQPAISEAAVRAWFRSVRFPGFTMASLFSEFHPLNGNLVASYKAGQGKEILLSYVDHRRMDPVYGLPRDAKQMVSTGAQSPVSEQPLDGRTLYGAMTSYPIVAVDVTHEVKLALMGYRGVTLEELTGLAAKMPVAALAREAK